MQEVDKKTLKSWIKEKSVTIIDVRSPLEREKVKIDNSISVPMDKLTEYDFNTISTQYIVTQCQHGIRSKIAAEIICKTGKKHVYF